ncbi:hypothetical protein, partial [Streptomyces hainanensis]
MAHTGKRVRNSRGEGVSAGRRTTAPPRGRWREAAGTVAVVADEAGFALLRHRCPGLGFADHAGYLRATEALLRSLTGRHGHTSVALFDPAAFADYCEREGLAQDSPASRARYTAEVAAQGATVPYAGQPIEALLPELRAARRRLDAWELGGDLLAAAGGCRGCGAPLSRCAFRRAAELLAAVLERVGPGAHHLVATVLPDTAPLAAELTAEIDAGGELRVPEPAALALCTVLAVGLATGEPGGLVARSKPPAGGDQEVRGWSLRGGLPRPLTAGEVFAAYCTDATTGEPIPPEPDVAYLPA